MAISRDCLQTGSSRLAEAHQQLPRAETTERAVLDQLASETRSWTGDEAMSTLRARTQLLAAAWDTMGRILFLEGKLAEAKPYIRAAWLTDMHPDVGGHLGDLELAEHRPTEALRAYQMAAAAISQFNAFGVRLRPGSDPESSKLEENIAKAKAAGGKGVEVYTHNDLQKLRMISLGASDDLNGTAEYRLLLSPRGFESIEPNAGKDLPGAADLLRKVKLTDYFPTGIDARLERTGFLNCFGGKCELVLSP